MSNQLDDEMLIKINNSLNSSLFIEMLKKNWKEFHNISYLSKLIGEVYIHHIIHKDGYGFENYIRQMESLYSKIWKREISPEEFDRQRSKNISIMIASRLGIGVAREITSYDMNRIKDYFLQEYVVNGYVSHSFPDAIFESISANGLLPSTGSRNEKSSEVQAIQEIFMNKGIVAPLGGYPYYGGSGIYYEHDFTNVFQHVIDSPEWFKWFTSSDHLKAYHKDLNSSPYVLRDEEACRRNVIDLCSNAGLNQEETDHVMNFYVEQYSKFSSPKLNVALIPKVVIGKNNIEETVPANLNLLDTITFVMHDEAKQYVEHQGNVYYEVIFPDDIRFSHIPVASLFMEVDGEYSRESREYLMDPIANLSILDNAIQNKSRMSLDMLNKVCQTKVLIEEKSNYSEEMNVMFEPIEQVSREQQK